jgi:uncharacterized OB-fold protein
VTGSSEPPLVYQRCPGCESVWYFRREFCSRCGRRQPDNLESAGIGTVAAATVVHRAPDGPFRGAAPYLILLVELDEGFRIMAHGDPELELGARVRAGTVTVRDRVLPYFTRV